MRKITIAFKFIMTGFCLSLLILQTGCKQDFLEGVKTPSIGKVYMPTIAGLQGIVSGMANGGLSIDTSNNTANFSIPVFRGGFGDTSTFTVEVAIDKSLVVPLIASGALPSNTEALAENDCTLDTSIPVSFKDGVMQGAIQPKISIDNILDFSGKTLALGIVLKSSSKFSINDEMKEMVLYFDVDSLVDEAIPPTNLINPGAWEILRIADNDDVKFTIEDNGAILANGGNGGHQGVFQAIEVQGGKDYAIDMHVKGGGALDTWYEVYVADKVPVQGVDYTNDPEGINRLGLNTWTGCGIAPFDGELSSVGCVGSGKVVHVNESGIIYIVIKSGGASLGPAGILATDIDFRKMQ